MARVFLFILTFFMMIPQSQSAFARSSDWAEDTYMKARLLIERDSIKDGQKTLNGAIHIQMPPDWHTYWRTSGDAGLPPTIDWNGSENMADIKIAWPTPERFDEKGYYTLGYKEQAMLPFTLSLKDTQQPLLLKASISLLVCSEQCVPQKAEIELNLPTGTGVPSAYRDDINRAFREVPHNGNLDDLKIENVTIGLDRLVVTAHDNRGISEDADIFIEVPGISLASPPYIEFNVEKPPIQSARFIIPAPQGINALGAEITGKEMTITFRNRGRSIEKSFSF